MNSQNSFAPHTAASGAKVESSAFWLRAASFSDEVILWRALSIATLMPGGDTPANIRTAKEHEVLSKYVENWDGPGDVGVIAESGTGEPAGAAWVRPEMHEVWRKQGLSVQFYAPEVKIETLGHDAPELVIAVFPSFRNAGLGHTLLNALFHAASGVHSAIQLNV